MVAVVTPTFLEAPENVRVKCESVKDLGGDEIACYVVGVNKKAVVIVSNRFFDSRNQQVLGLWIGEAEQGKLIDFPSGDRLLVDAGLIEAVNGNPIR